MDYSYGAQQPVTNTQYTFQGGTNTSDAPPIPPSFNPYAHSQQQANIGNPMYYWSQLRYVEEPTLVDIIADIVQDNEDAGLFLAEGGFQALSDIVKETVDNRLMQFFSGLVLVQEKGEEGTVIKVSAELSDESTKSILTKNDSDLATAITGISSAVKEKLCEPKSARIQLHREAAKLQRQSGVMGAMANELANSQQGGGVGQGALRLLVNGTRMAVGQPPLPPR